MDEIRLTLDGTAITVDRACSVLDAALSAGVPIPHLCHLDA